MLFPSFLLLAFAACHCSAIAVLGERATLTEKASTNAGLLAAGKAPAAPRALAKYVRSNPTRQQLRAPGRRQQASPVPIIFPPHPNTANYPIILQNTDDTATTINLQFSAQIFGLSGTALRVSSNGYVGFSDSQGTASSIRVPSGMNAFVAPFSNDLIYPTNSGRFVSAQADATSVTIRFNARVIYNPEGDTDLTLYYTTAQPGRWFVYYDAYTTNGDGSAGSGVASRVEAGQNQGTSRLVTYAVGAFRSPNDNLAICFDTLTATVFRRP